ncbi:MAG: energy transducer TonB [Succinivibrionaceae bacterium]|nr:energy transducer TonB [Succinivibrionaceae bacterium]
MTTSVLPHGRRTFRLQAFIIASLIYYPLMAAVIYGVMTADRMRLKQISPEIVRMLMTEPPAVTDVPAPEPVKQLQQVVPEPAVKQPEPEVKPEPQVKPEPKIQPKPQVKPEPKVQSRPVRKPEPVRRQAQKPQPAVRTDPKPAPQSAHAVRTAPAEPAPVVSNDKPQLMVYGKSSDPILAAIVSALKQKLIYPKQAQMQGKTGTVIVSFLFHPNGSVTEARVVKSNAAEVLQKSAIKTVTEARGSFPKITRAIRLVVPINYQLH